MTRVALVPRLRGDTACFIHPNARGVQRIADRVAPLVQERLGQQPES